MIVMQLLMSQAQAANVVHSLCVSFDEQFSDPWPDADYWKTNTPRVLRGIRLRLTDVNTNVVVYDQFAAQNAPLAGCHTMTVDSAEEYKIEIFPEAQVRGYHLIAQRWDGVANGPVDHPYLYNAGWTPPASPNAFSLVVPWDINSGFGEIAVAQYMANKAGQLGFGTWPGNEIYYLLDYKLGGGATVITLNVDDFNGCVAKGYAHCTVPPHIRTGNLIGQGTGHFTKFTIAHETGHWIGGMLDRPNDPKDPYFDMSASLDECNGWWNSGNNSSDYHQFYQREYQSSAAIEGWANFYAAWAFNRSDQSDCVYRRNLFIDYDLDNDQDDTTSNQRSCEGAGWDINHNGIKDSTEPQVESYIDAKDWLQNVMDAADDCWLNNPDPVSNCDNSCGQSYSLDGVGNEVDWMRYFWDMHTDEDLSLVTLGALYGAADPHDWDDVQIPGTKTPRFRYISAAQSLNIDTEHYAQDSNGQDH